MYIERHTVDVVTNGSGAATAYTSSIINGKINSIQYVKDGSTPFSNGVDFIISGEDSGLIIWDEDDVNASKVVAPRMATHGIDGVANVYTNDAKPVLDKIGIANERIKIVIAQGGDTKTGRFIIHVE